jgi:NADH dehydrogenase
MNGVHVSLGVEDPVQLEPVEHRETATVAAAAAQHGLERISYLTGSLVRVDYGPKIAEHRAKLAAEQAIQDSGVPYTFFRPTYFTNTLPRHVQGRIVVMLGRQRQVLHPVCAEDFAAQVARAFATPAAASRDFYIHGPQPLTLRQALGIYRQIVVPDRRLITVPLPVMSAIDRLFMGGKLAPRLQITGLLARLGEHGDPAPANELLGTPTTTVEDWCRAQLPLSSVNGAQA